MTTLFWCTYAVLAIVFAAGVALGRWSASRDQGGHR